MAELTARKYMLQCKIKFHKKTVHDAGRTYERTLVLLVPDHTDMGNLFFTAWLPETLTEYFEIVGVMPHPVNSSCRMSIHRGPNDVCENHYMTVMNMGVEEILKKRKKEGDKILVEIQPEGDESEGLADQAIQESEGNYEKVE